MAGFTFLRQGSCIQTAQEEPRACVQPCFCIPGAGWHWLAWPGLRVRPATCLGPHSPLVPKVPEAGGSLAQRDHSAGWPGGALQVSQGLGVCPWGHEIESEAFLGEDSTWFSSPQTEHSGQRLESRPPRVQQVVTQISLSNSRWLRTGRHSPARPVSAASVHTSLCLGFLICKWGRYCSSLLGLWALKVCVCEGGTAQW